MRRSSICTGLAILAFTSACGGGSSTHAVSGTLLLKDYGQQGYEGTPCDGAKENLQGFSDLAAGAPVTVYDENGKVIATTSLQMGTLHLTGNESTPYGQAGLADCSMPFTVTLPAAKFYRFQIGSGNRGSTTVSASDLAAAGWKVSLGSVDIGNR